MKLLGDRILPEGTELGAVADIPDQGGRLLDVRVDGVSQSIVLLRQGMTVRAYRNRCPHFLVKLAEKPEFLQLQAGEWLRCSVHYARFRWDDGMCFSGDCEGESLDVIPVVLQGDRCVVGTANAPKND